MDNSRNVYCKNPNNMLYGFKYVIIKKGVFYEDLRFGL